MQTAIEYLRDVNIIWSKKAGRDRFSTYPALRANYTYTIKEQQRLRPTQRQLPHALRVRRCVDQVRAVRHPHAGWDTGRRLDFQVRNLEARQARRYAPAARAVAVT